MHCIIKLKPTKPLLAKWNEKRRQETLAEKLIALQFIEQYLWKLGKWILGIQLNAPKNAMIISYSTMLQA